jgi:T5SS/PEP-CTERM-associated repeat protein
MPRHYSLFCRALSAVRRLVVIIFVNCLALPAVAADRFWITPTGGTFGAIANWSATDGGAGGASVPGVADIANFTLNNTYEVNFTTDPFNTDLDVENGNVTFDLNLNTYTLTGLLPIVVGGIAGQTGRLTVTEGILAVETLHDNVQVGSVENATGFLTIGAGGQLGTSVVRPLIVIGPIGTGTLTVQNNGLAFSSDFLLATNIGASGTVTITGPQALLDISGTAEIGDAGAGTMTVSAGAEVVGAVTTIGQDAGSTGTVTITGAGSRWIQSSGMIVGASGVGTLNVQSGGELSAGVMTIANVAGGFGTATISSGGTASTSNVDVGSSGSGTLTVTGTGSSLDTNGSLLTVGSLGTAEGDVTVSSGGAIEAGSVTLGSAATTSGSLSISGSTSTFTSAVGIFTVGSSGDGALEITGGTLNSLTSRIAASVGSTGAALVTGVTSTWNADSLAIGGQLGANGGAGTLAIEAGGTVNVAGVTDVRSSAGSALTIDGGTLNTVGFTRLGSFNFLDGTLHVTGAYDNGAAATPLVIDGASATDLPTMRLSGTAAVTDVTSITVGSTNRGALILDGGRAVSIGANQLAIGTGVLSSGSVTVTGSGSSLSTPNGTIAVGGMGIISGGSGTLTIGTGSVVTAGTLIVFAGGIFNLEGGRFVVGGLGSLVGSVNFNAGEIAFSNATSLSDSQLDALLGASHILDADRRLSTTSSSLTFDAPLTVSGGEVFAATSITNQSALAIDAGLLAATTTLTNNLGRLLAISGTANVSAAGGITNSGTIQLNNNLVATAGGTLTNSGTIRGSGFIGNNLTNNSAGQVQATAGSRLEFQGGVNTNSGLISFAAGEIVFTSSLTNSASTGLISGGDAILRVNGVLTNNGSLAVSFGNNNFFGDTTNTGSLVVTGGAHATFYDDITQNGTFIVREIGLTNSTAVVLGAFTGSGGSTGGGDIFFEGDLRPGNSPATVTFDNDIGFGAGVTLEIELGGTSPGTQYDQVHVTGDLALDGTLDVSLVSYSPAAGHSFDILDWGSLSGTFDELSLPSLSAGLMWNASQLYTIGVLNVGLAGDYNLNGVVDVADYVVWRKTLGQSGFGLAADGNANNQIDPGDLTIWRANFGQTASGSASGDTGSATAAANAAVPEPAALGFTLAAAIIHCMARRRRPSAD